MKSVIRSYDYGYRCLVINLSRCTNIQTCSFLCFRLPFIKYTFNRKWVFLRFDSIKEVDKEIQYIEEALTSYYEQNKLK
jgi:hypothetical protein